MTRLEMNSHTAGGSRCRPTTTSRGHKSAPLRSRNVFAFDCAWCLWLRLLLVRRLAHLQQSESRGTRFPPNANPGPSAEVLQAGTGRQPLAKARQAASVLWESRPGLGAACRLLVSGCMSAGARHQLARPASYSISQVLHNISENCSSRGRLLRSPSLPWVLYKRR
jgi:hypothetical protein